jgi:predicted Zn finger-like uncharacterized protein
MSTIVDCPSCNRKLRVPDDLLGKKVKCPTCSGTFDAVAESSGKIPAPSSSPPPDPGPFGSSMPQMSLEGTPSGSPAADSSSPAPVPNAPGSEAYAPSSEKGSVPPSEQDTLSQNVPKSGAEEELVPCPYCGEKNPVDATRCGYCREHLDDEDLSGRPWDQGYRPYRDVRRDSEPHRGTLILTLGIVSIVSSVTGFLGLIGLIMGICTWVMGQRDLKKMQANMMDPQGLGSTQAGWICGIIGTAFGSLSTLCCVGYMAMVFGVMASVPKMAPPPPPTARPGPVVPAPPPAP